MPIVSLEKIVARTAAEVCARYEASDEARRLPVDGMSCERYLSQLMEQNLQLDVIRFLAQALPKREAVWWAARCARTVTGPDSSPAVRDAIVAAECWCSQPQEQHRRAAQQAADAAGLETPAGCAALAAFLAEGSLAPANVETIVPPAEHLTGQCVTGAVMLAGIIHEPDKSVEKYAQFIQIGLEIANGSNGPPSKS